MIRCILLFVCAACIVSAEQGMPDPGHVPAAPFAFAPAHLRFVLPATWVVIPDETLERYKDGLRSMWPQQPVPTFVLGIQQKAEQPFQTPYALLELDLQPMPSPAQIESNRCVLASDITARFAALNCSGLIAGVSADPAVFSTNLQAIIASWRMIRGGSSQELACLMAQFPCRYGYARFHFFMDAGAQQAQQPAVDSLICSVRFDPGFEYEPRAAEDEQWTAGRIISTIVVITAVVVVCLLARSMNRAAFGARPPSGTLTPPHCCPGKVAKDSEIPV